MVGDDSSSTNTSVSLLSSLHGLLLQTPSRIHVQSIGNDIRGFFSSFFGSPTPAPGPSSPKVVLKPTTPKTGSSPVIEEGWTMLGGIRPNERINDDSTTNQGRVTKKTAAVEPPPPPKPTYDPFEWQDVPAVDVFSTTPLNTAKTDRFLQCNAKMDLGTHFVDIVDLYE